MKKLLILDLDDPCIRRSKSGRKLIYSSEKDQEITQLASSFINWYKKNDWNIFGVTYAPNKELGVVFDEYIKKQQITLNNCPLIEKIYASPDENSLLEIVHNNVRLGRSWMLQGSKFTSFSEQTIDYFLDGLTGLEQILLVGDKRCSNPNVKIIDSEKWFTSMDYAYA